MPQGFRLPGYDYNPRNALIDFSPITGAIDNWQKQQQQGVENERQNKLMDFRRQEADQSQQRFGMEKEKHADSYVKEAAGSLGNLAKLVLADPAKYGDRWGADVVETYHAAARKRNPNYVPDPRLADPRYGPAMAIASAGMGQDILDHQNKQTQLRFQGNADARAGAGERRAAESHTSTMSQYESKSPTERAQMATTLFKPEDIANRTPAYLSFVANGKYAPGKENTALESAVAKTSVELAENDVKAAYGAQQVMNATKELRGLANQQQDGKPVVDKDGRPKAAPGLSAAIGPVMGNSTMQTMVNMLPFTQTFGVTNPELNSKIQQIRASIVQSAQQQMKGLGSVSDADAKRVEQAVGNLDKARNHQEFLNAVDEIERSVALTMQRGQLASKQFPGLGSRINPAPDAGGGAGGGGWKIERVQ